MAMKGRTTKEERDALYEEINQEVFIIILLFPRYWGSSNNNNC